MRTYYDYLIIYARAKASCEGCASEMRTYYDFNIFLQKNSFI